MKKQKLPSVVSIAILTVITVVIWIGLDVYRALTTKPAPTVSADILAPITPNLDEETLDGLQERVYIDPEQIEPTQLKNPEDESVIIPAASLAPATPSPSISPSPIASPSASPIAP